MTPDTDRWNHNIHYHPVVISALPSTCDRVLDVGCGDGTLTRELSRHADLVVGLDRDEPTIRRSTRTAVSVNACYLLSDLCQAPFPSSTFDAVVSVATLHHVDAEQGLAAMVDLLRPGGTLVIIGLARRQLPRDLLWEVGAAVGTRLIGLRRTYWEIEAPTVWPPPATYLEMKSLTARLLPGAVFKRRLLWRYSIVWTKPEP